MGACEIAHRYKRVTHDRRSNAMPSCLHCTQNSNTNQQKTKQERNAPTTREEESFLRFLRSTSSLFPVRTYYKYYCTFNSKIHNPCSDTKVAGSRSLHLQVAQQKHAYVRPLARTHARTLATGARQLVVHEALDTTSMSGVYLSSLTPITNMGASPDGALITT